MEQRTLEKYVRDQGCEWHFNPPHFSHFWGVWQRQIGTIRRVVNAMLLELGGSQLTRELLVTLMAEVTAIVNARLMTTVPSDTDEPQPLSPAMLLSSVWSPTWRICSCRSVFTPSLETGPVSRGPVLDKMEAGVCADTAKEKQMEQTKAKP